MGDHLDSLAHQTDTNGNVTSSTNVSPYGQLVADNSGDEFPFTDHERDSENSTDHTRFRHYSPAQGRWISPDPSNGSYSLIDPQSLNRYSYLTNRPMNKVDRLGLDDDDDDDDNPPGGGTPPGDGTSDPVFADTNSTTSSTTYYYNSDGTLWGSATSTILTGDSSPDAAPSDGGSTSIASGTGGESISGDLLSAWMWLTSPIDKAATWVDKHPLVQMTVMLPTLLEGNEAELDLLESEAEVGQTAFQEGIETFYRTMSQANFEQLLDTGEIPATGETFITESLERASMYNGVTVQFNVQPGTTDSLVSMGVRDNSNLVAATYGDLPAVESGWGATNAYFKGEDGLINIGLGQGPALQTFNGNIVSFQAVSK